MGTAAKSHDSESERNPDELPEYYQTITSLESDGDQDTDSDQSITEVSGLDEGWNADEAVSRISSVRLMEERETKTGGGEGDGEDGIWASDAADRATSRAFREAEVRRNEPLPRETRRRVMEAMRGVSWRSPVPQWAATLPEDHWMDSLELLRMHMQAHRHPATVRD